MGLLRSVFGPSKEEVWAQLARELGGALTEGGLFGKSKLEVRHGPWTITLDTYTQTTGGGPHGSTSQSYTRIRAPYVNLDGFRFTVYREGLFSGVGRLFGMQDVEVGYPGFDRDFVIKGNDEARLRALFADDRVRLLLQTQPRVHLTVKDDEGWFGADFPDGVDELYFQTVGVIRDLDRLRELFDLFAAVLDRLCHMGSAYEGDPGVAL